jgi:hypothetical protein
VSANVSPVPQRSRDDVMLQWFCGLKQSCARVCVHTDVPANAGVAVGECRMRTQLDYNNEKARPQEQHCMDA